MLSTSPDMELLVDPFSISAESKKGLCSSFVGDGINVMFTGSELPLNQLASFPGLVSVFASSDFPPERVCSNSAASSWETGSGEIDRSLPNLRKGRKIDDREGEFDPLEGKTGLKLLVLVGR